MKNIGFLNPGKMGISLAASAKNTGLNVYWASHGRSPATRERAEEHGLTDIGTVAQMTEQCGVIVSICPPSAAVDVAQAVADAGFSGTFVEANAISPEKAKQIEQIILAGGGNMVDGSVIGGPAWQPDRTWLYLSGAGADQIAACFSAGPLETEVMGNIIGDASAIKMCYAAYTKGSAALMCAVMGTAESLGVREALEARWAHGGSDFAEQTQQRVRRVTAKAWRFEGEMVEIAATFSAAGLPGEFHLGAQEVYARLAQFKVQSDPPALDQVLTALIARD